MLLALLFGLLGWAGQAMADGPSGSTECHVADDDCDGSIDEDSDADGIDDDGDGAIDEDQPGDAADDPGENQVTCGSGTDVNGNVIYAGSNGVEACNDSAAQGPQGRVIVSGDGYVAVDGDGSNPEQAQGYARFDSSGAHCGDENNQDSTGDQTQNTQEDCNTQQ